MTLLLNLVLLGLLNQTAVVVPPVPVQIDLPEFDAHKCTIARVDWTDAMIKIKASRESADLTAADIDQEAPKVVSFGCASQTPLNVVLIHSFVEGKLDDYLTIPKGWITKITKLEPKTE
jgi:hypothetical protein